MSDTAEQPLRSRSRLERRYVVLHHTGHGEAHYDLMLERAPPPDAPLLWTFRSPQWPICSRIELVELADHRADYLTYEGPVSGGRGQVRQVESGTFFGWRQSKEDRIKIPLHLTAIKRNGRQVRVEDQRLHLARDSSGQWFIEP